MAASVRQFRQGQFIFREGDPPTCMYLIKAGTVSIRRMKSGAYVELARLHHNEVIGELSFFDRAPRSAAAVAMTDVEALEITFESLDKIYTGVPDYMKSIIACVADRLRKANDTIRRLQNNTVEDSFADGGEKPVDESGDDAGDMDVDKAVKEGGG